MNSRHYLDLKDMLTGLEMFKYTLGNLEASVDDLRDSLADLNAELSTHQSEIVYAKEMYNLQINRIKQYVNKEDKSV